MRECSVMQETVFTDQSTSDVQGLISHTRKSFTKLSLKKSLSLGSGKKARVEITPPSSPTSLSSFTSKPIGHNGYYDNPVATYRLSSSGEGEFKFLDSQRFENTEVFTITNGTNSLPNQSPKSLGSSPAVARESSFSADKYKWTDNDTVDGKVTHRKTKSRKICLLVLVIVLVLGLLAGVAVILGLTVFKQKGEESPVSTQSPVALKLDGFLSLQETWTSDLDNTSSPRYKETEKNFTREIDSLMSQSYLSDIYIYTEVIGFSAGSIKVRFKMAFNDNYKLKVDSEANLADKVEQEIKESSSKTKLRVVRETVRVLPLHPRKTPLRSNRYWVLQRVDTDTTTQLSESQTVPLEPSLSSDILQQSWTLSSVDTSVISPTSLHHITMPSSQTPDITDSQTSSTSVYSMSHSSLLDKSYISLTMTPSSHASLDVVTSSTITTINEAVSPSHNTGILIQPTSTQTAQTSISSTSYNVLSGLEPSSFIYNSISKSTTTPSNVQSLSSTDLSSSYTTSSQKFRTESRRSSILPSYSIPLFSSDMLSSLYIDSSTTTPFSSSIMKDLIPLQTTFSTSSKETTSDDLFAPLSSSLQKRGSTTDEFISPTNIDTSSTDHLSINITSNYLLGHLVHVVSSNTDDITTTSSSFLILPTTDESNIHDTVEYVMTDVVTKTNVNLEQSFQKQTVLGEITRSETVGFSSQPLYTHDNITPSQPSHPLFTHHLTSTSVPTYSDITEHELDSSVEHIERTSIRASTVSTIKVPSTTTKYRTKIESTVGEIQGVPSFVQPTTSHPLASQSMQVPNAVSTSSDIVILEQTSVMPAPTIFSLGSQVITTESNVVQENQIKGRPTEEDSPSTTAFMEKKVTNDIRTTSRYPQTSKIISILKTNLTMFKTTPYRLSETTSSDASLSSPNHTALVLETYSTVDAEITTFFETTSKDNTLFTPKSISASTTTIPEQVPKSATATSKIRTITQVPTTITTFSPTTATRTFLTSTRPSTTTSRSSTTTSRSPTTTFTTTTKCSTTITSKPTTSIRRPPPPTTTTSTTTTTSSTTTAPDRPPIADAGPDMTVNLPTTTVTLDGRRSTDDRGIVEYTWTQESTLTATMAGVKSAQLELSNLQEGTYVFRLGVRDEAYQTSSDTVKVTVLPEKCLTVTVDVCEGLGFTKTQLPNMLGQDNITQAIEVFTQKTKSIHNQICQNIALSYLCSLFFPKCDETTGGLVLPCRSLCEEAVMSCSEYFVNPIDCSSWMETDCIKPPTPPSTTTMLPPTCEAVQENDCRSIGFNYTGFPNLLGETSQDEVLQTYDAYFRWMVQTDQPCHPYVGYFLCGSQFPVCVDGQLSAPCRRVCEVVVAACEELSFFDCDYYPEIDCVAPQQPVAARLRQFNRKCKASEFTCGQVTKCISADKVCNGVNDCTDWTDEMDCQCDRQYQYQCKMGMCIMSYQECDGTPQCPDNSDESHCDGCRNGQVRCPNTDKCIMREWLCDGRNECEDGWDEWDCDRCSRSNFTCTVDQSCIPMTRRCDGINDCSQGEDEWNCVKQENEMLQLLHKKTYLPLCADTWSDADGNYTCEVLLGEGHFINSTEILYNGLYFAKLRDDGNLPSLLGNMALAMDCKDNKAISVNCKPRGCGKRMAGSVIPHITGGEQAAHGNWPWHAALYMGNMYFCGGTLINEQFVITAAHCVEKYVGDFQTKMKVKLGANNRKQYHETQRVISVQAISSHSMHVWFERNDIALLQLANPVNFTEYIQPVCLPDENEPLPLHSECWTIGWGKTRWDADYAEVLQQLKMKLWDTQKCNSSIAWNGEVYDTFLCAGYHSGVRSICKGDSGGPLLCLDKQYVWRLVGISSYVANFCNMTERPNIFSDVRYFLPWINNITECKFRCDNGKCLYSGEAICNRVDDCGDNSDEIKNCNYTAACSFDDKFLCGYNWTGWGYGFDNKKAIMIELDGQFHTQSYAPQFDSTYGKLPGYFFFGKQKGIKEALLWSPKFSLTGQTCVRFSYYMRGEIRDGLQVYIREFYTNGSYTTKRYWESQIYVTGTDEWKTGYFDITRGIFQIVFKTNELLKVAVDDVKTIPGMCSQVLCDAQREYRCVSEDGRRDKCIPRDSRCNLVIDCPDGADEQSCPGPPKSYECTFENGNVCGLRQNFGDASDWWLTNGTFVRDESLLQTFEDHSLKSELGHMFYLNAYNLQSSRPIYMSQFFYLNYKQYCMSFYYARKAEVNFTVHVQSDGRKTEQYSILPTFYGWTLVQFNLPRVEMVNITYDIRGLNVSFYKYVVMDDITLSDGLCPSYICPAGYYKCKGVDRCFPGRARCDRNVDCQDESDEANCECHGNEFQCNNGRCIPESRMCDRTVQCLDGSDEQACASYDSVTCNFQHPYLCGYEFQSYSKYSWRRWSGNTPTPVTGPQYDHTLGNTQGFYIYAEANEGSVGDNSSVRSPSFYSGYGHSLEFWYHMFSSSYMDTRPGILHFILENADTGVQSVKWSTNRTDLVDTWRGVCYNLPPGETLIAVFTAIRDETTVYGVDFAIDDVKFNNYRCNETPKETTTQPTTSTTTEPQSGEAEWFCNNGQGIPESYRCDGATDCIDGSDERGCF